MYVFVCVVCVCACVCLCTVLTGAFADLRLGADVHVGVRMMKWWEYTSHNHTMWASSNEGTVSEFDVVRRYGVVLNVGVVVS